MRLPVYPSTSRNRDSILTVLNTHLPNSGKVIETASATGEHIVFFAKNFPKLIWQPTDKRGDMFWAIKERSNLLKNVTAPLSIDLTSIEGVKFQHKFNAFLNINMIHIAPWEACRGLFELAGKILLAEGFIYLYGPYKERGKELAKSNNTFDLQLRSQNPEWGIRFLDDVINLSEEFGFKFHKKYEMPSNNLSVIFKKIS